MSVEIVETIKVLVGAVLSSMVVIAMIFLCLYGYFALLAAWERMRRGRVGRSQAAAYSTITSNAVAPEPEGGRTILPGGEAIEYGSSTVVKMSKQPRYQRWKHRTHPTIKAVYDLHVGKCAPFNNGEIRDRMMARLVDGEQITALGWDDATNYEPEEQVNKSPEAPGKHSFLVDS